jgi:sulfate transport system permease protein
VIDLPFALPTIVASLVMLALYGPNSPVDLHLQHTRWGIGVALLFVTLPFVVRSVQPVLLELDRRSRRPRRRWAPTTPTSSPGSSCRPVAVAAVRRRPGVLPGDRRVRLGGADRWRVPGETEVSSQWIRTLIENDDRTGAAAISIVLLLISFIVLLILRAVGSRAARREELAA